MKYPKSKWDCTQPIKLLPNSISKFFVMEAKYLLDDLNENFLEVILIPAPDPHFDSHKIRVSQRENPEWYHDLWNKYAYFRKRKNGISKLEGKIKRKYCLNALKRISDYQDGWYLPNNSGKYWYDFTFRKIIKHRLINGYEFEGLFIPKESLVEDYFR